MNNQIRLTERHFKLPPLCLRFASKPAVQLFVSLTVASTCASSERQELCITQTAVVVHV